MIRNIKTIIILVLMALFSRVCYAVQPSVECIGVDGTEHVLSNDPHNGTNIVVDDVVYRFRAESTIGNKKVSTFKSDADILANVILIVDPVTHDGDVYIVIYQDASDRRDEDIQKLDLHCKI